MSIAPRQAMVTSPTPTATQRSALTITWEHLPDDFQLDDTPVENTGQPLLAGALRESLELANHIQPQMLIASNFGLCATVNQELVIKAPDWVYIPTVLEPGKERKSYTPHLEGDVPTVVMEFLSETEGGEYSVKRTPPLGKWFFYEQVLNIPTYIIFEPATGLLEVYRLTAGRYELEQPNPDGRHWLAEMQLFLGTWRGTKEERTGYWLRWWTKAGDLLPWAVEQIEQEKQRAEQEKQRADRLATYLRSQGINPDEVG